MLKSRDKLGDYEIVARLKAGGMAQVYLARRKGAAGFTRPVALKIIHPHLAGEAEFVRMFVDEATLSSKIEAPNVVNVEELGQIDGTWFQAMEYVHGASLAQVIRALRVAGRRCTPELAVHIVSEIATGLHAAHETTDASGTPLGIVHRDVSPQNVLVSYRGNVKVCDFGIAKALHRTHVTQNDALRGKLAYMAPEQARGEDVDRRADIYSLGIVLWELLVLDRMFDAPNDILLLEKVRHPTFDLPGSRTAGIPAALDDVVSAVLSVAPADRPQTAAELRRLLLQAVPGARDVENEDVAALLRAVMGARMDEQAKLLPLVSESTLLLEVPPARPDEPRPDDALRQLTLPAVVVPTPVLVTTAAGAKARWPAWGTPALVGLACAASLAAALAVQMGRGGRVGGASPPASEPLIPAIQAIGSETAAISTAGALGDSGAALPSAASGAIASAASAPPRARRPPLRMAPRGSASVPRPLCRKVGGVELCE